LHWTYGSCQVSIAEARTKSIGSLVTFTGTVTSGSSFGQIRFIQDATAGISVYSSLLSGTDPGDSVLIAGTLTVYKGQLQINPVQSFNIIQSSRPLPAAIELSIDNPFNAAYESMRVKLSCAGVSSCESVFDEGWYEVFDSKGSSTKLVIDVPSLIGKPVLTTPISTTGIWVKVNDDFQLWAQSMADAESNCTIIQKAKISFDQEKIKLRWIASAATSWVEYGMDAFSEITIPEIAGDEISVSLASIIQGQIYQGRLGQLIGSDTVYSLPTYFSAPALSDISIPIFFDRQVDASFSDGSHPAATGPSVIETDIIARIDQVTSTLDIAMYNTTRVTIVQALQRAVQRGVAVRYIAEDETSNTALDGIFSFPILYRQEDGIMHNKFVIADADDPDKAWLWTGSTNFTTSQLSSDPNHAYVLKNQALALNYRREFDEMWGSSSGHEGEKAGQEKSDNTDHLFKIGNTVIESYFSPSDETNCHIMEALASADHQALIGLLLLTKEDLTDEIIALHQKGVDTRVIIEDEGTSSTSVLRLRLAGVPVAIHDLSSLFHHKYAIIDEGHADSDPQVISGSHNWTLSADVINDENTLIFHDQSVTNIFRQEFEARWSELESTSTADVSKYQTLKVYPNPATDHLDITNPTGQKCMVNLIDANGCILRKEKMDPHETLHLTFDGSLPEGLYFINSSNFANHTVPIIVIQH
jgi:phosphatidylserine/phosphatidylglycerophosphate/cardiolipin synthase-like enzyme